MQPESDPKPRSFIFPSWDCSVMWHHPRAAMQGLVSFRGTITHELMATAIPKGAHKQQSEWNSVFKASEPPCLYFLSVVYTVFLSSHHS